MNRLRRILRTFGAPTVFAGLTALGAQVGIDLERVSFTLQSLAVVLAGMLLGPKRGTGSQVIYLVAGALGLPVFKDGASGVQHLQGKTGGYLVGFLLTAWLAGIIAGARPSFRRALISACGAQLALVVVGGIWFVLATGRSWTDAGWTLLTLLPGVLVKGTAAGAVVWGKNTWMARRR